MSIIYEAMRFARRAHSGQVRKYTGNPYIEHPAEVAGLCAAFGLSPNAQAVAWLHDCIEDCGVTHTEVLNAFGREIADAVWSLTDSEAGTRAERKSVARARVSDAAGWVQTIKCADIISNTASIAKHDPKFAYTYYGECRAMVDALTEADPRARLLAYSALEQMGRDLEDKYA